MTTPGSTREYMHLIGKQGQVTLNALSVAVRVLDVKYEYGHVRYLVSPVTGSGQVWTEKVKFSEEAKR